MLVGLDPWILAIREFTCFWDKTFQQEMKNVQAWPVYLHRRAHSQQYTALSKVVRQKYYIRDKQSFSKR